MTPTILAKTNDYFVINKPAGLATEPPSPQPTLRDWLLDQKLISPDEWGSEERMGIVHRLDTDTSGVILWAKNPTAQQKIRTIWQGRAVEKTYLALVAGQTDSAGTIELAIERDNRNDRQNVALLPSAKSRPAITKYKTLAQTTIGERAVSLLELHPITGRTHQIRVHCKAIGHPLIGDKLYGEKISDEIAYQLNVKRQLLHAWKLSAPEVGDYVAELPDDFSSVLRQLNLSLPAIQQFEKHVEKL